MENIEPTSPLFAEAAPHAGSLARTFAFFGALIVLIVGGILSLGAVLLAPAGMAIAAYIWRRRGRTLSPIGHWFAAAVAATVVFVAFAGAISSAMPKGSWEKARQAADSAQKISAKQPPPAWLQRLAPGVTQRAAQAPTSERAQTFGLAFGAAFAAMFFVGFFGTLGWLGGMLAGLAFYGRWPGQARTAPA
jgi:hypothetical protein